MNKTLPCLRIMPIVVAALFLSDLAALEPAEAQIAGAVRIAEAVRIADLARLAESRANCKPAPSPPP